MKKRQRKKNFKNKWMPRVDGMIEQYLLNEEALAKAPAPNVLCGLQATSYEEQVNLPALPPELLSRRATLMLQVFSNNLHKPVSEVLRICGELPEWSEDYEAP